MEKGVLIEPRYRITYRPKLYSPSRQIDRGIQRLQGAH